MNCGQKKCGPTERTQLKQSADFCHFLLQQNVFSCSNSKQTEDTILRLLCVKAITYIISESLNWDLKPWCFEVGFSAKTNYNLCITFLLRIET